jgi:hypothetical protein
LKISAQIVKKLAATQSECSKSEIPLIEGAGEYFGVLETEPMDTFQSLTLFGLTWFYELMNAKRGTLPGP